MRSTAEGQRQRINELGLSENVWAAWRTAYGKFPIDATASPVLYCFYIITGGKEDFKDCVRQIPQKEYYL